jgi:protein SCO1/2
VRLEPDRVWISHQAIPKYMDAMVMPFRVHNPSDLATLHPGAQIAFDLVVRKHRSYIERIRKRPGVNDSPVEDQGDRFRIPIPPEKLAIGASVPDFEMRDQDGVPMRFASLRGAVVAVDFIYTRCPLPEVCPRLSANFARLQKRFSGRNLVLLSITLDPDHDTPEELRRYAKVWQARAPGWRFLTGDHETIRAVAARLGLTYWAEDGLITHTSTTAVIAPDGRLAALVEGSSYPAGQLGDLIESVLR